MHTVWNFLLVVTMMGLTFGCLYQVGILMRLLQYESKRKTRTREHDEK
jgi:hypothetical protein